MRKKKPQSTFMPFWAFVVPLRYADHLTDKADKCFYANAEGGGPKLFRFREQAVEYARTLAAPPHSLRTLPTRKVLVRVDE